MINGGGFGLGFNFTAHDGASPVMNRLHGNFRRLDMAAQQSAGLMGKMTGSTIAASAGLAAMAAGAAAVGGSFQMASAFGAFEQEMARVGALSNATAADLAMLTNKALEVGKSSRFSPTEAAAGMAEFAAQGFNARQQLDLISPALNLATGGAISVTSATEAMTSAMHVFGLSTEDASITVDKMLKISNATALQAGDLSLALGTVGRGAVAANQSLDEMLISMGLIKNSGLDVSVAAQSTSSALIAIAKNKDKFHAMGVEVTDSEGRFRPLLDIIYETDNALKGITNEADRTAKATELFTRFGQSAFSAISKQLGTGVQDASGNIMKGADALEFLRQSQINAEGAAADFADRMSKTFEGQRAIAKATMETFKITFGQTFAEVIQPFFMRTVGLLKRMMDAFQNMDPGLRKTISRLIVLGGALLFLGGAVLSTVASFGLLRFSLAAAGTSLGGMLAGMLPVLLTIAAITAGVAIMKLAIDKNLGGIGDVFRSALSKVTLFLRAMGQLLTQGFLSGDVLKDLKSSPNGQGVVSFISVFMRIGTRLKAVFAGIGEGFDETFSKMGERVERLIEAFGKLGGVVGFAWGMIVSFSKIAQAEFTAVGEAAGGKLAQALDLVAAALTSIIEFNAGLVEGFIGGIIWFDKIGGTFRGIELAVTLVIDAFKGIATQFGKILDAVGLGSDGFEGFGKVLGFLTSVILIPLQAGLSLLALTLGGMAKLAELVVTGIRMLVEAAVSQVNKFLDNVASGLALLPESVRPEAANEFIAARAERTSAGNRMVGAAAVELGKQVLGGAVGEGESRIDLARVAEAARGAEDKNDAIKKEQLQRGVMLRAKLQVAGRDLGEIIAESIGNINAERFGAVSPTTVEGT